MSEWYLEGDRVGLFSCRCRLRLLLRADGPSASRASALMLLLGFMSDGPLSAAEHNSIGNGVCL